MNLHDEIHAHLSSVPNETDEPFAHDLSSFRAGVAYGFAYVLKNADFCTWDVDTRAWLAELERAP